MMGAFLYDVRFAARALVKRRGFAATVIAILGVGIGAATTIYSVVDTVVLRALPYPEAGRLVRFQNGDHSYPSWRAWQAMTSFERIAATRDHEVTLTGDGPPLEVQSQAVSPQFFEMYGGVAAVGRLFGAADYPGGFGRVVLSHGFWLRRFGGDPGVIGRTLRVDGAPSEVIGVLNEQFRLPEGATGRSQVDLWFALDDGGTQADNHGMSVLNVVARLRPDVSPEAAQEEVDAQRRAIAAEVPSSYVARDGSMRMTPLVPLREATVGPVSGMLFTLLGAVVILLLIACSNAANLLLAQGTARVREVALRGAIGASRGRIGTGVIIESVMLSLIASAMGVILAFGGVELFARYVPDGIPRIDALAVDLRVLGFSAAVAMLTGIAFGALPALQAMRTAPADMLKEGASSILSSRRGQRVRSTLVVTEIALAAVLVTGAGLLMRSLVAQVQVDPGFEAEGLVMMSIGLEAGYDAESRRQFSEEIVARATALPGVRNAAAGWTSPFKRTGPGRCCWRTPVVGDPTLVDEASPFRGMTHPVTPGYFNTLAAAIAFGREFEPADGDGLVAILNRPAARQLFGREDVVGRTITHGGNPTQTLEVIGVVDGVHEFGPTQGVEAAVYVPYARFGTSTYGRLDVFVRADAPSDALARSLQETVWAIDPDVPIEEVTTMERRMSMSVATPRFLGGLVGAFAIIALLLACGGVYGSMAYAVGQRQREMGIRLALGAAGSDVVRLVLRHSVSLAVAGVLLGGGATFAVGGAMNALLWGVEPTDPITLAMVTLLLGSATVLAAWGPAWRAGRTDPMQTLRSE